MSFRIQVHSITFYLILPLKYSKHMHYTFKFIDLHMNKMASCDVPGSFDITARFTYFYSSH